MRKLILAAFFMIFLPFNKSFAHSGHTHPTPVTPEVTPEEVCIGTNNEICAHVHFAKKPNSAEEAPFVLHYETANEAAVQNLKVELWMEMEGGHGHGSAPVSMKAISHNKYQISNVWFVMMGAWTVRTHFDVDGIHYKLDIPVNIYQ